MAGVVMLGMSRRGELGLVKAGELWRVRVRWGGVWCGSARQAGYGLVRIGYAGSGKAGTLW